MNQVEDVSAFYRPEKRRWIIKYKDFSGEWRSKTTSAESRTERAALDWGRGWLAEMRATGISPVKRAGNAGPTVSELKPRWLKLRREACVNGQSEFKPATIAAYEWHLEVIEETFDETFKGEMPLGKFDDRQARAWVKTLKATNAPNTCGNVYSTLRSLIEDAIAERWVILPANPLALDAVKRELPLASRSQASARSSSRSITCRHLSAVARCRSIGVSGTSSTSAPGSRRASSLGASGATPSSRTSRRSTSPMRAPSMANTAGQRSR